MFENMRVRDSLIGRNKQCNRMSLDHKATNMGHVHKIKVPPPDLTSTITVQFMNDDIN